MTRLIFAYLIILLSSTLLLACSNDSKEDYRLNVIFSSVSGLKNGDSVYYSEKSIGIVEDILFQGKNYDSVKVVVRFNNNIPPIPKPCDFVLKSANFYGNKSIEIKLVPSTDKVTYPNGSYIQGEQELSDLVTDSAFAPLRQNRIEIDSATFDSLIETVRKFQN